MLLDNLLFDELYSIGNSLLNKSGLKTIPQNITEMGTFLETVKLSYEKEDFDGLLFANILFNFVSNVDVRDRHTTARIFEDIFSALFSTKSTDRMSKKNPVPPKEILELNKFNNGDNWTISNDLAGNKREKADISIGTYQISLKTLKGIAYDKDNVMLPKNFTTSSGDNVKNVQNNEINVGSLSFRALLKGIIPDDELKVLGDRKKGLGSGQAIRKKMLDRIKSYNKIDEFTNRLELFMNYVFDEDLYLIFKSHYQIKWILIPSQTFINTIISNYIRDENDFEKIWYRWENNNLRMHLYPLLNKIKKYGFYYKEITFNLGKAVHSNQIREFKETISSKIKEEIIKMQKNKK